MEKQILKNNITELLASVADKDIKEILNSTLNNSFSKEHISNSKHKIDKAQKMRY